MFHEDVFGVSKVKEHFKVFRSLKHYFRSKTLPFTKTNIKIALNIIRKFEGFRSLQSYF